MRAFAIEKEGQSARLTNLPEPDPGTEILISVRAASINGFDVFQASGALTGMVEHRFPTLIGRDMAGVVQKGGTATNDLATGEEVFGFVPSALRCNEEHLLKGSPVKGPSWCQCRTDSTSIRRQRCPGGHIGAGHTGGGRR